MKTTSYSHLGLLISLLFTPALTFLKQVLVLLSFVVQLTVGIKM